MIRQKALNTQKVTLVLGWVLLAAFVLISTKAEAKSPNFYCETNFREYALTISAETVALKSNQTPSRGISSEVSTSTQKTTQGFNKYFTQYGHYHYVHIENQKKLSSDSDFLAVENSDGHKVIFPLNCITL